MKDPSDILSISEEDYSNLEAKKSTELSVEEVEKFQDNEPIPEEFEEEPFEEDRSDPLFLPRFFFLFIN